MNRVEPEAACSRLTEEVALGVAGLYAAGDLSERNVDLIADLLDESWRRSLEECRQKEKSVSSEPDPLVERRHPRIEVLLGSLRAGLP